MATEKLTVVQAGPDRWLVMGAGKVVTECRSQGEALRFMAKVRAPFTQFLTREQVDVMADALTQYITNAGWDNEAEDGPKPAPLTEAEALLDSLTLVMCSWAG